MAKNVVGMFDTSADAQAALQDLRSSGFSQDQVSFVANNSSGEYDQYTTDSGGSAAAEGAGAGATTGTVVGGIGGLLAGLGAFAIPGIGPVVGLGVLGATLLGAGIGAAAGGLLGALVGAGIPEEDANIYHEGVRRGGTLLMVHAEDNQVDRAVDILNRHNVVDIDERGSQYSSGEYSSTGSMANTTGGEYRDSDMSGGSYADSSKLGTATGGVAGAATGAAIGSVGGPVGTVIGGVAGALTGGGVGAAGDAAGAEATDDDASRTGGMGNSSMAAGTAYGSATDIGTSGTNVNTNYTTGSTGMTGGTVNTGSTGMTNTVNTGDEIAVPIVEEQLRVGKRAVERGGVRVYTRVQEVPVEEQVTLRDETVHVERRPVNRAVTNADMANLQEGTIEVRETDEEVVVAKDARIVEEVVISKEATQHTETVRDTVRRTDVEVEQVPGQTTTTGYTTTSTTDTSMGTTGSMGTPGTSGTTGSMGTTGTTGSTGRSITDRIEDAANTDLNRDGGVGGSRI